MPTHRVSAMPEPLSGSGPSRIFPPGASRLHPVFA